MTTWECRLFDTTPTWHILLDLVFEWSSRERVSLPHLRHRRGRSPAGRTQPRGTRSGSSASWSRLSHFSASVGFGCLCRQRRHPSTPRPCAARSNRSATLATCWRSNRALWQRLLAFRPSQALPWAWHLRAPSPIWTCAVPRQPVRLRRQPSSLLPDLLRGCWPRRWTSPPERPRFCSSVTSGSCRHSEAEKGRRRGA